MRPASAPARPARHVARNCGASRMMWSAASASTTASGSRLRATAVAAAIAGAESRRSGSITTVASTPISSAWRLAKKWKFGPVMTMGAREHRVLHARQGLLVGRALADQRQKLLGQSVARDRPQPRPGAAGKQNRDDRRWHGFKLAALDPRFWPGIVLIVLNAMVPIQLSLMLRRFQGPPGRRLGRRRL